MARANKKSNGTNIGFEETLWSAADKMRNNMDPAEYKHVVLGLIFLKYISDAFTEKRESFIAESAYEGMEEDKDAYTAENVFWVPKEARWDYLKINAKKPEIGKLVDEAMIAIEKDNKSLKGVLPKNYARPDLDKVRLGELIDLISTIGLGDKESRSKDILGRVYEYFLGRFASAEGKGGGEFFTPQSVVKLLVEMLEPYKGRIYDPCCGSGGMFVQSEKFVEAHGGQTHDLAIYGQESNPTTWRLCKMNLAIRGIEGNLGSQNADTFHNDLHKDLKADFILANPPFNISDWGGERLKDDVRWKYGVPSSSNANYAWIQHMVHHLSPTGIAGFVLANGSLNQSSESEIRKKLIDSNLVDCIVTLPGKLFYTTPVSACIWIISRDRFDHKFRDRHKEILFINAQNLGSLLENDRNHRELPENDLKKITHTYHSWRSISGKYEDEDGFCRVVSLDEVKQNNFVLIPGRYIKQNAGVDGHSFKESLDKLLTKFTTQHNTGIDLDLKINQLLKKYKYIDKDLPLSIAQNSDLYTLGEAIYRYWFRDYNFPTQEGLPYKDNKGDIAESEEGPLPDNWRFGSLSELMDIEGGTQPPASEFKDSPREGYIRLVQIRDYDTDGHITYIPDKHKLRKCKKNDIMIARYGASVGRILSGLEGAYNVALVKVVPKESCYREYLRYYLKSEDFQNRLISMSDRSAQAGFNKEDLASFIVPIAEKRVYESFNELMELIFKKIEINNS